MSDQHWRMQLNNYLQSNGGTRMLQWEVYSTGPPHQIQWTAITYVRGVEYARCVGTRQGVTMENAAKQTLDALYADRRRPY
ncbi:hypothetical protein EIP91_010451 [Steccherinum ochraceum]|uniref:DRBM domain-containing protein n=1 Tax=Steccherinum ochraceum TaxID=92696 RepID=A0A4R0R8H3_9APHY|nr:hypothetical protein EIP91_010451 [Steccherinum ochraceum]